MKKKFLSLLLALAMGAALTATALADNPVTLPMSPMLVPIATVPPRLSTAGTAIPTDAEAQGFVTGKGWMTGTDAGFAPPWR